MLEVVVQWYGISGELTQKGTCTYVNRNSIHLNLYVGYEEIFSLSETSNIYVRPDFIAANQEESEESMFVVLLQSILLQIAVSCSNYLEYCSSRLMSCSRSLVSIMIVPLS